MKFPAMGEVFFIFPKRFLTGFPLLFFPRGLTQTLRTKSSDTNCCVLGIGGDMYKEKIFLLLFFFIYQYLTFIMLAETKNI